MNRKHIYSIAVLSILIMILLIEHLRGYYFIRPLQLIFLVLIYFFGFFVIERINNFYIKIFFCSIWLLISLLAVQLIFYKDYTGIFTAMPVSLFSWLLHGGITIPIAIFVVNKLMFYKK